jgi:hypothetical protein
MVDVQALLEACWNMLLRYVSFIDEVSFWQAAKLPVLGLLWKCWIFRISKLADNGLMKFWLHIIQSLFLTDQAGIGITLKECIVEVPGEIF